ncbi:MAG: hypothetical protein GX811_11180 [Lentisphaerae bacterium]|nr:hypothetical protein [Lentisphaerota bacterium]
MCLYGITSRIRGFDPVKAGDVASGDAISKVYEGLLQYSYLVRPYRLEPCLASAMPDISEDGLIYTFKIRDDIYFQDDPCFKDTDGKGRKLVAEDFVYSIKRVADIKSRSTGYWAFNNRIVGLDEFREASAGDSQVDYSLPVSGLVALDDRTLQITLSRPYPQLLWILAMHYAFAVPREAVEFYGQDFLNHPVGTGPYILKSWRRNYRVEFVRNPKWEETGRVELYPSEGEPADYESGLLDDAGKAIPFIDRVVQYVIDDVSIQWLKFISGELESSGISRDDWDAVVTQNNDITEELKNKGIRLYTTESLNVFYIGFNMTDPIVGSNKKLRQALTCAFNSEELIKFYNHRVVRAKGPIPPAVAGYSDKPAKYPYNPELAARLLAEAGYPEGIDRNTGKRLQLTLEIGGADASTREFMELLSGFFRKLGVIVNPGYNNWPSFLDKLSRNQCQMFQLGWVADYPDAENFLQLFYGPNSSPGPNHSVYKNTEVDELYERVRVMKDSAERTELYKQMAELVIEDCPWIFMYTPMAYGLHHSWVQNYKPHDFPYGMLKYRKIDVERRSNWKKRNHSVD